MIRFLRRTIPVATVGAVAITLWYLLAYLLPNNFSTATGKPLIIPPPHRLFEDMNRILWDRLARATWITTITSLTGLALSMVIGVGLGIFMHRRRWLERSLWPYLVALQVTPIIALVPLIIRIVGSNFTSRVLVTVIITFFPIVSNTLFGFRQVDPRMHDLFTLHKATKIQRLLRLEFPAASPAIFTGFRVSAGLAVIGAIVGDFFFTRGDPGLGKLISLFFLNNQSGPMFLTAITASLLGFILFITFGVANQALVGKWHDGSSPA
jgi:NitT/TauT family transport system permease protein